MKELSNIYKEVGQQFIDDLFKDYLLVTEKLSGSSFSFEKDGKEIKFYKSNDKPINLVDRTLMVYYESAISYINRATSSIIADVPDNWRFCFQYFVHNEPGVIQYDKLPKNNLVLTHIQIKSPSGKVGKLIEDPRVIKDWSNTLNVTPLLPIFSGYLTGEQKQKIRDFIATPREDQHELFKTSSFAEYIIKVLNPAITSTALQSDLAKPIESIIFKFFKPGNSQTFSAKMIDPYTVSLMKDKKPIDLRRVPADINEIIILDILSFIEERGLKGSDILSTSPDERYIELISNIFNDYVIRRGSGLKNIDIEKANFAKGDEFNLNVDLIPSEVTRKTLLDNERMQDLFKIMLGSLRKKRNPDKAGNVLTPSVISDFNLLVNKIEGLTNTEVSNEFKTFGDYLTLKEINESYQTVEELVIEKMVLDYNNFINLGKIINEADVMNTKIKNPETGRSVKVSSALGYDKDTEVHQIAKNLVDELDDEGSSEMSDSLKKKFSPNRVKNIKPKIGTKEINPNKLSEGRKYTPDVRVNRDADGNISEINIGSTKLKRIKEPNQEKLIAAFKKQNPDLNDTEVKALADRTNRAITRHNKSLEKWENLKDIEFLEPIEGLQDLSQKERADKIGKEYPKLIANTMKSMIGDNPTEKEKEVLKGIENLSTIEDAEEFNKASIEVLRKMDDIEAIRKGSSDLSESLVYIYMNKKGFRTELPAGENFPVADIICLGSDMDINNLDPNSGDYAEKVSMQGLGLAVNLETIGGISVKKDGGAASALKNKIGESQFKNKETADKLNWLADNHNAFLGTIDSQTSPETIKKGNQLLDETEDWAVKNGVINKDKLPLKYGNRTADEWAADTLKKWEDGGYGPFCDFQKDALASHLRASLLVAELHNNDIEEQSYGNINVSTAKQGGGMNITDGITTASLMKPSPNPGFKFIKGKGKDGCTIPRPNAIYSANLVHANYDPTTERFKMNK
jgi:hypothetical protein